MLRILEARFHPRSKKGTEMIRVARLLCQGDQVQIWPLQVDERQIDPEAVRHKLFFLAQLARPDTFAGLCELSSDFWSFVDVSDPAEERRKDDHR